MTSIPIFTSLVQNCACNSATEIAFWVGNISQILNSEMDLKSDYNIMSYMIVQQKKKYTTSGISVVYFDHQNLDTCFLKTIVVNQG